MDSATCGDACPLNDAWVSNDGRTWRQAQQDDQNATDRWRVLKAALVWPSRNTVVVAGCGAGNSISCSQPGIWFTSPSLFPRWLKFSTLANGETIPPDVLFSIVNGGILSEETRMVIFNDQLWIFGRNEVLTHTVCDPDCITIIDGYKTHIWSTDGIRWTDRSVTKPPRPGCTTDCFEIPSPVNGSQRTFTEYKGFLVLVQSLAMGQHTNVWASADGTAWSKVKDDAPFGNPLKHMTAVFQNKFWLLEQQIVIQDYIWFTSDGKDWRSPKKYIRWTPRINAASAVFQNKMWLVGGSGAYFWPYGGNNEIWNSTNGADWTSVSAGEHWSPRESMGAIAFNDKLWVMGGRYTLCDVDGNCPYFNRNDIWSSTDGANWVEVLPDDQKAQNRWVAFEQVLFEPTRNMLVVIGSDYQGRAGIWGSTDGKDWKSFGPLPPGANFFSNYVIFRAKLWVINPSPGNDQPSAIYSFDGTWRHESDVTFPYAGNGKSRSVTVWQNKLWLIQATFTWWWPYPSSNRNQIWTSENGANWTKVVDPALFGYRTNYSPLVYNNKIWLLGANIYPLYWTTYWGCYWPWWQYWVYPYYYTWWQYGWYGQYCGTTNDVWYIDYRPASVDFVASPEGDLTIQMPTIGGLSTFDVRGILSATVKNFDIPHPLNPKDGRLIHASLEGPEVAVFYRGEAR